MALAPMRTDSAWNFSVNNFDGTVSGVALELDRRLNASLIDYMRAPVRASDLLGKSVKDVRQL